MTQKKYDAVVIGAGNGGLVAALRLLQAGKSVLLLERHNLPGGFATSFIRGRFEFEASLHELCDLGTAENPGDLYRLFDSLGIMDRVEFVTVPEAYRVISLETGEDYTMPFGVEEFIDQMERYVPGSRSSMETFFDLAKECRAAMAYNSSMQGKPDTKVLKRDYPNFMRTAAYPVEKVLNAMNMPRKAQEILNAYWCYLGSPENELGFLHYALMVSLYISLGAQIPKNRSHGISVALTDAILQHGGQIWYNEEVVQILVKNHEVCGVKLRSGQVVETRHVISNASPHIVYGQMVPWEEVPEVQKRLLNARSLGIRGFAMFLGLNKSKEELGLKDYSYFIYDTMDTKKQFAKCGVYDNNAQVTVCLNNALPDCSPEGTTLMYFTMLCTTNSFAQAVTEENYFQLKEQLARHYIKNFEKATGIIISDSIEEIEIATPLTYAHYTAAPEGSIYGYLTAGFDNMFPRLKTMYDEEHLKGLHFCGGHAMRSSGFNSAYLSGDLAGKFTLRDMKGDQA